MVYSEMIRRSTKGLHMGCGESLRSSRQGVQRLRSRLEGGVCSGRPRRLHPIRREGEPRP